MYVKNLTETLIFGEMETRNMIGGQIFNDGSFGYIHLLFYEKQMIPNSTSYQTLDEIPTAEPGSCSCHSSLSSYLVAFCGIVTC